jgi:hypothetical protein
MRSIRARLVVFSVALFGLSACVETPLQPADVPALRSDVDVLVEEGNSTIVGWDEGIRSHNTVPDSVEEARGGHVGGSGN